MEKIKAINDALKKPNRRNQWNTQHQTGGDYILDKETLEKLQQVIASGKLNSYANNVQQREEESNTINNENLYDTRYSRQLASLFARNQAQMAVVPTSYIMNMPVLVMPSMKNMYGYGNAMDYGAKIQTKEGPSPSPFPTFPTLPTLPTFEWPFASFFPILIRDPLLSIMNGGGWNNFIEYGQSADVCRKQKSNDENNKEVNENHDDFKTAGNILYPTGETKSRQKRAVKKRTVSNGSQLQDIDPAKLNKFFSIKPTTTAKPAKQNSVKQDTKTTADDEDLRFNFLNLFGNKYRQPTGPGFFINRLKVRRGGVAIAGPGGVATAGRGGTAIVGPGGLAYTQPGGVAVAGPAARVIALSSDADLTSIANRLQAQSIIDGSIPQLLQAIPEGKIVATGPIIYHHPNQR